MRINAEDPAGGGVPALAGHHHRLDAPGGPGVRLDAGYEAGDTVSQFYDNLVAKLVVWGADREAARRRMLRALDETVVEGRGDHHPGRRRHPLAPRLHRRRHSTNWVEERLDLAGLPSPGSDGAEPAGRSARTNRPRVLREVTAEVDGRRYEVKLWVPDMGDTVVAAGGNAGAAHGAGPKRPRRRPRGRGRER